MFRYGATTLQPNTWYHVTGVYDATAQTLNVYLNGQLDNGVLQGTVTASQQNSTANVTIGRRAGSTGFEFSGRIDDVRIYSRALTQAQIQADMATPLGAASGPDTVAPSVPTGLVATPVSTTQINLSWNASTDNVGVTGYQVFRNGRANCDHDDDQLQQHRADTRDDLSVRVRASDAAGNTSALTTAVSATTPAADTTAPTVQSINRVGTTPTNAASVSWTVLFSESVTAVDASDFTLVTTGTVTGATITTVSGSGSQYTVTAGTGNGIGTLGLNLLDNDTIRDSSANPLGGPGVNGNFTGQTYTIDKTAPSVTIAQAAGQADPTTASPINFTATFSETVTGFAANDISFVGSTVGGTLTAVVTGTGATYNVAVSGMTGAGNVVAIIPAGAATDAAGNASLVSTTGTDNTVTYNASSASFPERDPCDQLQSSDRHEVPARRAHAGGGTRRDDQGVVTAV